MSKSGSCPVWRVQIWSLMALGIELRVTFLETSFWAVGQVDWFEGLLECPGSSVGGGPPWRDVCRLHHWHWELLPSCYWTGCLDSCSAWLFCSWWTGLQCYLAKIINQTTDGVLKFSVLIWNLAQLLLFGLAHSARTVVSIVAYTNVIMMSLVWPDVFNLKGVMVIRITCGPFCKMLQRLIEVVWLWLIMCTTYKGKIELLMWCIHECTHEHNCTM